MDKPSIKPNNPCFSSGPCAKRPGWSLEALHGAVLGRSHRSAPGKAKLKEVIESHRELLGIPDDYKIGIVPASDTGAVEMALWSVLGPRPVDVFAWESFSEGWLKDITDQLPLGKSKVNEYTAAYGELPDLGQTSKDHDTVFVWNGTTSGVRVPNADWIADDRKGLTICDATSAIFAYDMPWNKLDITTWSWQKVLGSEAAHGMIVLSPRAIERLEGYTPPWPMPKIFRMTKGGKINDGIFQGATINTPSMLAVEDCLDALNWIKSIGGLETTIQRSQANFDAIDKWVKQTEWVEFLAIAPETRSATSICLKITDEQFQALDNTDQLVFIKDIAKLLSNEGVAHDIAGYRDAPAGLRIWGGATVETTDIQALLSWIEWGFTKTREAYSKQAA